MSFCIPSISQIDLGDLEDQDIIRRAKRLFFPQTLRKSDEAQMKAMTRFWALYFTEKAWYQNKAISVILDMIACARLNGYLIWDEEDYGQPFYTASQEETHNFDLYAPKSSKNTLQKMIEVIQTHLNGCLDKHGQMTQLGKDLACFSGFMALALCQAVGKPNQPFHLFSKRHFVEDFVRIGRFPASYCFHPPSKSALQTIQYTLSSDYSLLWYKLIALHIKLKKNSADREIKATDMPAQMYPQLLEYTDVSLMNAMKLHSMGLVSYMQRAVDLLGVEWKDLLDVLSAWKVPCLKLPCKQLEHFADTYLKPEEVQYGYNWARLISHDYFRNYNNALNVGLSLILAGVISEITQDEGIWRSTWMQKPGAQHLIQRRWGHDYGRELARIFKKNKK